MTDGERRYGLVLLGATGFTGRLTAAYLARRLAGSETRWAIAGRDRDRLTGLADRLRVIDAPTEVEVVQADVRDVGAMTELAASARVVLSAVGPYARHGLPVVDACVRAGTDYADLCGEPAFVELVTSRYDRAAQDNGVRIVHCCGFESVPADLGTLLAVRALPPGQPLTVEGFVAGTGSVSGGTWQSAIDSLAGLSPRDPRPAWTHPSSSDGRRARAVRPGTRYRPEVAAWTCPLPTIDAQVVVRSAQALPEYGPDFRYSHSLALRSLPGLALGVATMGTAAALAQVGPTRALLRRLRPAGTGPDERRRGRGWFRLTLLGRAASAAARVEVRGGDPGYQETAKMVAEAGLCLAHDRKRLSDRAGVLTPAVALGDLLLARLRTAGLTFEVAATD